MRKSRKEEIFQTGLEMFQGKKFAEVSVQDICDKCGITKNAFYYHFDSKYDLVVQNYERFLADFDWRNLKEEEQKPNADYLELLWKYEKYVISNTTQMGTDMLKVLYQYDLEHRRSFLSPFMEGPFRNVTGQEEYIAMVERGQRAGQIRSDVTAQELLRILFSAVIGQTFHWICAGEDYNKEMEIRKIFDFVMCPVKRIPVKAEQGCN